MAAVIGDKDSGEAAGADPRAFERLEVVVCLEGLVAVIDFKE